MEKVTIVGLELAKQVLQLHGVGAAGAPLFNCKLRRAEVLRLFEKLPPGGLRQFASLGTEDLGIV